MTSSNLWTDGHALAGPLHDLFRVDVTAAIGHCGTCGRTSPMAKVRVFDHVPGVVAHCPTCDQVLLRLARGPGRAWLNMRGLTYLQLPVRTGRDLNATLVDRVIGSSTAQSSTFQHCTVIHNSAPAGRARRTVRGVPFPVTPRHRRVSSSGKRRRPWNS